IHKCQAPGTLEYIGRPRTDEVKMQLLTYNKQGFKEEELTDLNILRQIDLNDTSIRWVNIDGLHNMDLIRELGEIFNIHALVLEDIVNTEQRPKADVHEGYSFVTIKMLNYNENADLFENEQLSLIFGKGFVLSFQEEAGDDFDEIRARIRQNTSICGFDATYLAYTMLDLIIDTYFLVMERFGDWIERLENQVIKYPNRRRTMDINELKRDLSFLRRNTWPIRDVIHTLQRREAESENKENMIFLNDLYDHSVQVIETLETYRDMMGNLMDLYLSNISYRMNEIMKTLTIITTLFIPLTFITSIYGMNFKHMPELEWKYGYLMVLAILAVVGVIMLGFFRKKRWL
nr:magnesium/cobalt transporter CorA [Bacteroidota bacterium]